MSKHSTESITQHHFHIKGAVRNLNATEQTVSVPQNVQRICSRLGPEYEIM